MSRKLTLCVVLASLAIAVPAGATMIDTFGTYSPNWVVSTVLNSGSGTFDVTTNPGKLTVKGYTGSPSPQQTLLRSDYSLSVGQTLITDTPLINNDINGDGGLCIATTNTLTSRHGMLAIWVSHATVQGTYFTDAGSQVWSTAQISTGSLPTQVFIAQTGANTFDLGYYLSGLSGTKTVQWSYTIPTGNMSPGAAVGYYVHQGNGFILAYDNLQITPEPSTLALLAAGLVGLLAYAWRKRR